MGVHRDVLICVRNQGATTRLFSLNLRENFYVRLFSRLRLWFGSRTRGWARGRGKGARSGRYNRFRFFDSLLLLIGVILGKTFDLELFCHSEKRGQFLLTNID